MFNLNVKDCSTNPRKDYSWDKEKLNSFRQRVLDDKTLKSRTDDAFLLGFLRGRKYSEDDALKYLRKYYYGKKRFPFIFKNLVPSALEQCMERNIAGYMETTERNGRVIVAGIAKRWDPGAISLWDAYRYFILLLEALLTDPLVQTNGVVLVIDFREVGWRHFLHFTPNFVYAANTCMLGCYPISYKQIHLILGKKFAFWFSNVVLIFCSGKLRERVFIHTEDFELLHKEVGRRYLPSEFGGDLPPFDPMHCIQRLKEGEQYFKDCEAYWSCDQGE